SYKAPDNRDRRDRVERQNIAWGYIMEDLTDAFLSWSHENDSKNDENKFEVAEDSDDSAVKRIRFPFDPAITSVVLLAKHGYMATSPGNPARSFSFSVLRLYHALSNRCPQLSMQVFVKSLCYLHCVPYLASYRTQFSIAFDTYLEIQRRIEQRLNKELDRTDPNRSIQYACVPCSYVLKDEPKLTYGTLIAIDGNNSLARVKRVAKQENAEGRLESIERIDSREIHDAMYIKASYVNQFENDLKSQTKKRKEKANSDDPKVTNGDKGKGKGKEKEGTEEEDDDEIEEPSPCPDRWKNLADDSEKKGKGYFSETGLFLASCRHEAALAFCDMVESGEK
ncbi:hypothetical protein SISNIDRAFT_406211, partial [Sistotremastrum niveocremeum HHB9708]